MAQILSILVKGCTSVADLAGYMEKLTGTTFARSTDVEWRLYKAEAMQVQFSVFDSHDFENDQGINFEQYPFVVDIQGPASLEDNAYYGKWLRLTPLFLASCLARDYSCECLVIENLQRVIESFYPEGPN